VSGPRDWDVEIDRWTALFARIDDPPEPFATALRAGWTPEARAALAADAEVYRRRHEAYLEQLHGSGVDLVRLDAKQGDCGACRRYVGKAFSLGGETEGLPPPPPLPICPACRHTLNLLTPFFLQSTGQSIDDLVANAETYTEPELS
jgi:hypothetical protein